MPASKKTSAAKPAAKAVKPATKAEAAKPQPAHTDQEDAVKAAAPKAPVKGKPQIPGKPEPSWAKFNQGAGHAQKMMKGRSFRHQGR